MKIAVVILNWNGKGFLEQYLPSVIASTEGLDAEVVTADNGSGDGSVKMLKESFPQVRLIRFAKNWGFAAGYNRALEKLDADLFVLLNSDVEVPSDWLFPLVEWMEIHPDCGICGPKILSLKERDRFEYAGAAGGFIDQLGYPFCQGRILDMTQKDEGQYDTPRSVFWISGAALMVRSEVWRALGGFDERFFAHQEEIDLCWRARLQGWKVSFVPRSKVWHLGGGTLSNDSAFKLMLNHRNGLRMLQKNLPLSYAYLFLASSLALEIDDDAVFPDEFDNILAHIRDNYEADDFISRVHSSVKAAIAYSNLVILHRRAFDNLSKLVYLLKGQRDKIKAVRQAHREFKKERALYRMDAMDIEDMVFNDFIEHGARVARVMVKLDFNADKEDKARLDGMYEGIIPIEAKLHKKDIFDRIKDMISR